MILSNSYDNLIVKINTYMKYNISFSINLTAFYCYN